MQRRPSIIAWLLLAPLLAWLAAFVIAPTLVMFVYSFGQRDNLGGLRLWDDAGNWLGTFDNYRRILGAAQSIGLLIAGAAGALVSAMIGFVLFRFRFRHWFGFAVTAFLTVFWLATNAFELNWVDLSQYLSIQESGTERRWLKVLVVSVNYAAASTLICLIAGYPVAYFIGRASLRWRGILLMSVMIPFWTSFLVRTYAWVNIMRTASTSLSDALAWAGWTGGPIDLYPSQTAVMIGLVYTYLPFMILPIYTSVEKLDGTLIEAALDLGATPLRVIRSVVLPLTSPGIVAGVLLVFVPAVGMFAVNNILGGGREMLIGNAIENQFGKAGNKPFGAALSMILLVLFVATYYLANRRKTVA